jgi:hypothetical protein
MLSLIISWFGYPLQWLTLLRPRVSIILALSTIKARQRVIAAQHSLRVTSAKTAELAGIVMFLMYRITNTEKGLKMLVFKYPSKKVLKENVGKPLRYIETSMFGEEYRENGVLTGANRPHMTGLGREFFANVTMENGLIKAVK